MFFMSYKEDGLFGLFYSDGQASPESDIFIIAVIGTSYS